MINETLAYKAVVDLLKAVLDFPVGAGAVPSPPAGQQTLPKDRPFGVVEVVATGEIDTPGATGTPEGMGTVRFQLTGHGVTDMQAKVGCHAMASVLLDKDGDDWAHDLVIAGHAVMRRGSGGTGPGDVEAGLYSATRSVDLLLHQTI